MAAPFIKYIYVRGRQVHEEDVYQYHEDVFIFEELEQSVEDRFVIKLGFLYLGHVLGVHFGFRHEVAAEGKCEGQQRVYPKK